MAPLTVIARWALWFVAFGGAVLWMFIVCASTSEWWYPSLTTSGWNDRMAVPFPGAAVNDAAGGYDSPLVWASDNIWEITLLGTTVLVAWCAAAAMCLQDKTPQQQQQQQTATRSSLSHVSLWLTIQVKRVLAYQLPPKRFWLWATGGLSGLDLCVGAVILGLDAMWLATTFVSLFKYIDGAVDKGVIQDDWPEDTVAIAKTEYAGLSFAWAIIPQIVCIMYPVPRSSFLHWLFGTEMPQLIKYHRWLGHIMLWNVSLHGFLYYVVWWWRGDWHHQALMWNQTSGINNLAGTIAWIFGAIVWVTSTNYVRRHYYQLFYNTHCLGITLFMLFSFAHYPSMAIYSIAGWFVYLLDLALRLVQRFVNTSTAVCTINQQAQVLTIHLTFQQDVTVLATQYVYLKFPTVNIYQRHPFSIASITRDPDTQLVSVACHVKALGAWTQKLLEAEGGKVPVVVEGPYGSAFSRWRTAEVLVLMAGGIGATPVLSILEDVLRERAHGTCLPAHVYFVWVSRHPSEFQLLPPDVLLAAESDDWLSVQLCDSSKEAAALVLVGGSSVHIGNIAASSPLHGFGYGYAFYCVAILSSALGAYAALLPGQAYMAWGARTHGYGSEQGYWGWAAGMTHFICMLLGIMLPPILLAAGVHTYRALVGRTSSQGSSQADALEMAAGVHSSSPSSAGSSHTKNPTFLKDVEAMTKKMGLGEQVTAGDRFVSRGRPDLETLLADIRTKHQDAMEVVVYTSGPKAMCRSVRDACQASRGTPYPDCHILSFSL